MRSLDPSVIAVVAIWGLAACGSDGSSVGGSPDGGAASITPTAPNAVRTCAPDCPVENLAQGAFRPVSLVVQGDSVFFATLGSGSVPASVYAVPTRGGPLTVLAEAHLVGRCKLLAADVAHVYWAHVATGAGEWSRLERVPVAGGPAEEISPASSPESSCIASDDAAVYWYGRVTGAEPPRGIWRTPKNGGKPVHLADEEPTSLLIRSGKLFFSTQTAIKSVATAGGTTVTVAGQLKFTDHRIDADDAFVYVAMPTDGTVARTPASGGTAEVLAKEQKPLGLVRDGATLFWSHRPNEAQDNRIMMLELGPNAAPPEIAATPIVKTVGAVDLAVDATHIYWASETEGAIRRTAK